jgi:hypothetical protein
LFCDSGIEKKYISVCSIFKDEAKFLKEWIEYHLLVGVDHFYLYNNNSVDSYFNVLSPYLEKELVTIIYWPDCLSENERDPHWALSTQLSAYEHAIYTFKNSTKWMVFLDVNEFLVPANKTVRDVLRNFDQFPGVILKEECFDASRIDILPVRKLLVETLELTAPVQSYKNKEKMIFKPELCEGSSWMPYRCNFQKNQPPGFVSHSELRINQYQNRYRGALNREKRKEKLSMDIREISYEAAIELMKQGYEFEDREQAIYKFIPRLLENMEIKNE